MVMIPEISGLAVLVLAALAEWLHARRCRRVALLAFGPKGKPREWTWPVPFVRVGAITLVTWALVNLFLLNPRALNAKQTPEGGYRHLIVMLDVSPSMQLKDAGPTHQMTRAQRASELVQSLLERVALDQLRVSVVAFYNGAKPVVVDTYDMNVVKNILDDLPLDYAFEIGKTKIFDGLREAAALAKPWKERSTTLLLVSDGDTVPDTGMPAMPTAVGQVLVVGVGDSRTGKFIDGHQSRQDASTLRQVAARLRGYYHDGNEKHLPSDQLHALSKAMPLKSDEKAGKKELCVTILAIGTTVLAGLPVALALAGSSWRAGRRSIRQQSISEPELIKT